VAFGPPIRLYRGGTENGYNRDVDVFIIPEARREIEALRALRPAGGTWGILVGHKRGPRFFVEKILAAAPPGRLPDERAIEDLDRIWPDGVIGLVVVRPGAAFRKAVLAPAWYGKLVLQAGGSPAKPVIKAGQVGFGRRFRLEPLPFAAGPEEEGHE
jgi:hypothetical protein